MRARYLPERAFPLYVFVPGKNPHPKKAGGHMEGESDPHVSPLNPERPSENEDFRYSLDLFNHGYYWESHVYFEALWNAHGREGAIADFCKGMIKLGAAGVKMAIGQAQSAKGHLERAKELFQDVKEKEGAVFLGLNLDDIIRRIDADPASDVFALGVHPAWE